MSELVVPELTIYWAAAVVLAIAAAAFAGWAFRLEEGARQYGFAVVVVCLGVAAGYVLMANEILTHVHADGVTPYGRFVGYAILFGVASLVIWRVSGASPVWGALLFLATYVWIASVIFNWLGEGLTELAGLVGIVVAFATVLFVFLGPFSSAVRETTGERRLCFGKLRNVTIHVLVLYLVLGVVNDHGIGLLDTFTGVFVTVYIDVVFVLAIGAILLRSETALVQASGESGAPDVPTADEATTPTDDGVAIGGD